jgi:prephenate dehydrogenase
LNPSDLNIQDKYQLLVVGAVGGIGRWFVEHVLVKEATLQLTLADTDRKVLQLAETLSTQTEKTVNGRTVSYPEEGVVADIDPSAFDAILLAVPIDRMENAAKAIVSRARAGCLVLDVASVKVEPLKHLTAAAPKGVSVLGTHPVFGPRVGGLGGQTVVLCETKSTNPRHTELVEQVIRRHGGNTERLTAERHDELMSVIQGLAHFVHLALGETFRTADFDLKGTLRVQTPPFHSVASVLGRLMSLSGERQAQLYAEIQQTPGAAALRRQFLDAATRLDGEFDSGDPVVAREAIERIARYLPPSTVKHLSAQSDEAVRLRQKREIELRELIESREVCGFRSRDGGVKIGRLVDFDPTHLVLQGEVVHGNGKAAAIYDEESQAAAALFGITKRPKEHRLSRRHYRPLSAPELKEWRETVLDSHSVDLTLGLPHLVNAAALAGYLVDLIPELLSAKADAPFDPEDRSKLHHVTYHLRCVGDRLPDRVKDSISNFVEVIGGQRPRHPVSV